MSELAPPYHGSILGSGCTLYFIRHGETDWNRVKRLQGQMDIPINALGRQQAARNGAALAEHLGRDRLAELDFIASPLIRCVETMEIAREAAGLTRTGFATDDRLKEIRYGAWEGASLERLKREDRAAYVERRDNKFRWRPVDGESYADLLGRARDWAATIERDTVVVSHGGISRVLRALVTPLEDEEIPVQIVPQDKVLVLSKDRFDWV